MRIAFVGHFTTHKGSQTFKEVVKRYALGHDWFIFGQIFDFDSFNEIKSNIAGSLSYSQKKLPELLQKHQIDLVLLLSNVQETFSRTFYEAINLEVPIIGFKVGFPGYKFPNYLGFVELSEGADGIVRKIDASSLENLKLEVQKIKSWFIPEAEERSRQKYELIEKILK